MSIIIEEIVGTLPDTRHLVRVGWRLLAEGRLNCEPIVQPIVNFADLLVEYPKIATHPSENIKLGVRFPTT